MGTAVPFELQDFALRTVRYPSYAFCFIELRMQKLVAGLQVQIVIASFGSTVGNGCTVLKIEPAKGFAMRKFVLLFLVFTALIVAQAGASVVTSIPGGYVFTLPAVNSFGGGPQTVAPGITWTSTNVNTSCGTGGCGSVFGFTGLYGFGFNGDWTGALGPMAGLNDSTDFYGASDTMTFSFASPAFAVGGFLNYYPNSSNPTTIAVWDSMGNLIESYDLTFNTSGANDTGAFYGFQETSPIISYFTLTDNYIGITGLTAVIPEPSSLLLIGAGLLGIVGYGRRRLGL